MSHSQGLNIKLYSGKEPWDSQFYSSTCDSLYVGGSDPKTNCPNIYHEYFGVMPNENNPRSTVQNIQDGNIDRDFFKTWFKKRPIQTSATGADIADLVGSDQVLSPGSARTYWNVTKNPNMLRDWSDGGEGKYITDGFQVLDEGGKYRGGGKYGANGWDWALQACRQEYGSYVNPDVKCDDPVCQTESVAVTNPAYFESGCTLNLHGSCVSSTIAKAVAEPIADAVIFAGITVLTGGSGDAAILGEIAAEGAGAGAAAAAGETAGESVAEGLTDETLDAGADASGEEGAVQNAAESDIRAELESIEEHEGEDAEETAARNAKKNACQNYKKGGLGKSASIASQRSTALGRGLKWGQAGRVSGVVLRAVWPQEHLALALVG